MNITIIPIPAFRDNYIWLLRRGTAAVVVDPGAAEPVLDTLQREGLQLAAILITHHHADHCDGIAGLLAAQPVPVYGPAAESITGLSHPLAGGERIRIDALAQDFSVLAVPGHTSSHLAYVADSALFCGDTLFGAGCGRLFEGTPAQMLASLDSIAAMPEDTAIYCAHEYTEANLRFALAVEPGNAALQQRVVDAAAMRAAGQPTVPSTLVLELATNPFLRSGSAEVIAAAQGHAARGHDRLAVFTAIREWKNSF
jgi:hydroxyacylglutathione hydrolase